MRKIDELRERFDRLSKNHIESEGLEKVAIFSKMYTTMISIEMEKEDLSSSDEMSTHAAERLVVDPN